MAKDCFLKTIKKLVKFGTGMFSVPIVRGRRYRNLVHRHRARMEIGDTYLGTKLRCNFQEVVPGYKDIKKLFVILITSIPNFQPNHLEAGIYFDMFLKLGY